MPEENEKQEENMFDNVDDVENEFSDESSGETVPEMNTKQEKELSFDDVERSNFIKLPAVGQQETYVIQKITENPNTEGRNKDTGEKFTIGLVANRGKPDERIIRRDVHTDKGVLTIPNWELFYKFFGRDSDLMKIKDERRNRGVSTWDGIQVTIKRNYDGSHANRSEGELKKLMDFSTEEEAREYKRTVANALKNNELYSVSFNDPSGGA